MASYNDIGRQAKEVLYKGFNESKLKISINNILPHGVTIGTSAYYDHVSKKSDVGLDFKFTAKRDKVNWTIKKGFSAQGSSTYVLSASGGDWMGIKNCGVSFDHTGKYAVSYFNDKFNGELVINPSTETEMSTTPTVCLTHPLSDPMAASVGITSTISSRDGGNIRATSVAATVGDKSKNISVSLDDDGRKVGGLFYAKATPSVEVALKWSRDLESESTFGEVGLRHTFYKGFSVSGKIASDQKLSVAMCRDVTSGIKVSTSLVFDAGGFDKTKLGCGIDVEHDWLAGMMSSSSSSTPSSSSSPTTKKSSEESTPSSKQPQPEAPLFVPGPYIREKEMTLLVKGLKEQKKGSNEQCP